MSPPSHENPPFLAVLLALSTSVRALDSEARITPAIQAQIDVQKRAVTKLASNSTLVSAVREQNKKRPDRRNDE